MCLPGDTHANGAVSYVSYATEANILLLFTTILCEQMGKLLYRIDHLTFFVTVIRKVSILEAYFTLYTCSVVILQLFAVVAPLF